MINYEGGMGVVRVGNIDIGFDDYKTVDGDVMIWNVGEVVGRVEGRSR